MPVYCYKCPECGQIEEAVRTIEGRGDCPECPHCDGVATERAIGEEQGAVQTEWVEPIYSDAAGVHPDQVPEARNRFKNHEYADDGRMIFRSHAHRRQCLKDIGMFDKDAYC